jgi:poly(3-hydroxybutyrate) depolymerase
LCKGIPAERKDHYEVVGAGHYGIFSGRRWRDKVYPRIADFIRAHHETPSKSKKRAIKETLGSD